MKKISPVVWKTAYFTGWIFVSVQIVLGLCWSALNFGTVPNFPETKLFLEMSETWVLDEYVGPGYVLLLYATRAVQSWMGFPYQIGIYILQLGLCWYAVYRFLHSILGLQGRRVRKSLLVFAALFINTIPFLLQNHFSVLPYSLAGTVYLLLVSALIDLISMVRGGRKCVQAKKIWFSLSGIMGFWVLSAMLLPEYMYLSGIVVFVCLLYAGIVCGKMKGYFAIVIVAGGLLSGMLLLVTTQEGSRDRMQNTVESQAMRRFAWPYLAQMEAVWPWDISVEFSYEELAYSAIAPERVLEVFGPSAEKLYGKKNANKYFGQMAVAAVRYNTKEVVMQLVKDFGFYSFPQAVALYDLAGNGATYTGQNYEKMQENGRGIATILARWSGVTFLWLFLVGIASLIRTKLWKNWLGIALLCLVSQAVCWTWLTAGMISYLVCPVNIIVWGIVLTAWMWAGEKKGAGAE